MTLTPQIDGRPAVLRRDGWVIYLGVHDKEYLRQARLWRLKRVAAHPDKPGGTAADFNRLTAEWQAWREEEARWYAELGLLPPDNYQSPHATIQRRLTQALDHGPKRLSGKAGWQRRPKRKETGDK